MNLIQESLILYDNCVVIDKPIEEIYAGCSIYDINNDMQKIGTFTHYLYSNKILLDNFCNTLFDYDIYLCYNDKYIIWLIDRNIGPFSSSVYHIYFYKKMILKIIKWYVLIYQVMR